MKAVFFDVDGTLIDTLHFVWAAFEHATSQYGLRSITPQDVVAMQGAGLADCYRIIDPNCNVEVMMAAHRDFQSKNLDLAVAFPNSLSTLKLLKQNGIHTAAITSRGQTAQPTLELTGLSTYLDLIIGSEDVENLKPHPEGINKALAHFALPPLDACMVGDTIVDIQAGKNAGVHTVGVTYGFYAPDALRESKPDFLIGDIQDILPLVSTPL